MKPKCIISFCIQHQINHLVLTGSQATLLLSQEEKLEETHFLRLPELKSLILSSSLITEPVRHKILTRITDRLFVYYGINEFGSVSIATPEDIHKYPGTVGRAYPGVEIAIVDDNGNPSSAGEIGNILLKSSGGLANYIDNFEATQKAFTKEGYYSGDMGRLLENGNLIFEGRKDDMMIFSGVNIYPRELESVLDAHPNVTESAVFPLMTQTHEAIPIAVVSIREPINESELLNWCTAELGWRSPKRIFFRESLPRNSAGKVLKRVLAKEVLQKIEKLQRNQ
jgi:acyl-coenzyme A synthetase/AMP-(fatty) acid ligase